MEDDELNTAPDQNRALAHYMHELYSSAMRQAVEEGIHLARWVVTSLLAINGAAAIATWGISMNPVLKVGACSLFIVGIVTSLLSAHITAQTLPKRIAPIGEAVGYWLSVKVDGLRAAELEKYEPRIQAANKKAQIVPTCLGWAALLAFLAGVAIAGFGGLQKEKEKQQTVATPPEPRRP